jgi:hypothetical protein
MKLTSLDAREILRRSQAPRPGNFHALSSDIVESLLTFADSHGYRTPRNANGSRARYWHDHLQRVASLPDTVKQTVIDWLRA